MAPSGLAGAVLKFLGMPGLRCPEQCRCGGARFQQSGLCVSQSAAALEGQGKLKIKFITII